MHGGHVFESNPERFTAPNGHPTHEFCHQDIPKTGRQIVVPSTDADFGSLKDLIPHLGLLAGYFKLVPLSRRDTGGFRPHLPPGTTRIALQRECFGF